MRTVETMTPFLNPTHPPARPVPEPRGTICTSSRPRMRTISWTCSVDSGKTTAAGRPSATRLARSCTVAREIPWSRSKDRQQCQPARHTDWPRPNLLAIGLSGSVVCSRLFWRSRSVTRRRLRLAEIHLNPTEYWRMPSAPQARPTITWKDLRSSASPGCRAFRPLQQFDRKRVPDMRAEARPLVSVK